MDAIAAVRPARTLEELTEALRTAMKHAAKNGVTSVQDLPGNARDLDAWEKLREGGEMSVRVNYRPSLTAWERTRARRTAMKNDEWLRVGVDGVVGLHGRDDAEPCEPRDVRRAEMLGVLDPKAPVLRAVDFFDALEDVAFGSDWDVAPLSPLEGIFAAVTRHTTDGNNPAGWFPEQKITVEEALRAYTSSAAYAAFEEGEKGTLSPGKLADFVVLSADVLGVKPEEIEKIEVDTTVLGGKAVYSK